MQTKIALVLALALIVLWSVGAMAAGGIGIDWNVLAGGGGHISAAAYALDNTAGQAAVGVVSSGSTLLCAGFWCMEEAPRSVPVYLPLLLRRSAH
jgi:hypothetical protein